MIGMRERKQDPGKILDLDASMQGSLVFKDPVNLRINGRFEGTLNARGSLTIGEQAVVNADITGEFIVVSGKVNGAIHALKELKLLAPAAVTGDIRTPLLSIAEGALFEGSCKMLARAAAGEGNRPALMTPDDVAKYLEVDAAMILSWVNAGKLPGKRQGDTWTFDRATIDEWIASGKIQ